MQEKGGGGQEIKANLFKACTESSEEWQFAWKSCKTTQFLRENLFKKAEQEKWQPGLRFCSLRVTSDVFSSEKVFPRCKSTTFPSKIWKGRCQSGQQQQECNQGIVYRSSHPIRLTCSLLNPHHPGKHPSLRGSEQPQTRALLCPPKPRGFSSQPCAIPKGWDREYLLLDERWISFSPFEHEHLPWTKRFPCSRNRLQHGESERLLPGSTVVEIQWKPNSWRTTSNPVLCYSYCWYFSHSG